MPSTDTWGRQFFSAPLAGRNGDLELTIADSGCGFEPEADGTNVGVGLISMRERAIAIGGDLTVESSPGEGTTVRLSVPASRIAE